MKPKPPRFRYVDVLSTTITHRCFDELRRRAYNNKVSTSKLSKSIISEYLKDIEKIASLLEIKKINEPKRNILINSVDPIISDKIEEIAINYGTTKSEVVRKILLDYLSQNETPNGQVEEQKQLKSENTHEHRIQD